MVTTDVIALFAKGANTGVTVAVIRHVQFNDRGAGAKPERDRVILGEGAERLIGQAMVQKAEMRCIEAALERLCPVAFLQGLETLRCDGATWVNSNFGGAGIFFGGPI